MKKIVLFILLCLVAEFIYSSQNDVHYKRYTRVDSTTRLKPMTITIDTTFEQMIWNDSNSLTKLLKPIIYDFFQDRDDKYILTLSKTKQGLDGFTLFGEDQYAKNRLFYDKTVLGVMVDSVDNRQKVLYIGADKGCESIFADCFSNSGSKVEICTLDSLILKSDSIYYLNTVDIERKRNGLVVVLIDNKLTPVYFKRRNILYTDYKYPEIQLDYSSLWDSIVQNCR